ncbi:hypothetical protein SAMN05421747_10422 [Parapedobacter composti]|uniref:Uncharacterized protein n=1 Tax=Parapedobacter composti TaxID=623281 RepID=A0A1I1G777_9SPHI|nr:hypothetical protein SAMN05421747_10422 [Parapedobacter composti]
MRVVSIKAWLVRAQLSITSVTISLGSETYLELKYEISGENLVLEGTLSEYWGYFANVKYRLRKRL